MRGLKITCGGSPPNPEQGTRRKKQGERKNLLRALPGRRIAADNFKTLAGENNFSIAHGTRRLPSTVSQLPPSLEG